GLGGSGVRTKSSHLPSGDQRGEESCLPSVMRRGASFPRMETLHIAVSYPSFFSLAVTLTKATRDPSGEICGSPIQLNWKISFSVMERFCAWAKTATTAARPSATIKRRTVRCMEAPKDENDFYSGLARGCPARRFFGSGAVCLTLSPEPKTGSGGRVG